MLISFKDNHVLQTFIVGALKNLDAGYEQYRDQMTTEYGPGIHINSELDKARLLMTRIDTNIKLFGEFVKFSLTPEEVETIIYWNDSENIK